MWIDSGCSVFSRFRASVAPAASAAVHIARGVAAVAVLEDGHEPVAGGLVDVAPRAGMRSRNLREVSLDERVEHDRRQPFAQAAIATDVDEQHGDVPLLLVELRARRVRGTRRCTASGTNLAKWSLIFASRPSLRSTVDARASAPSGYAATSSRAIDRLREHVVRARSRPLIRFSMPSSAVIDHRG